MLKKLVIEFIDASSPVCERVTKFGGTPNWCADPQWPLSRKTGKPMRFIAQVAIPRDLFPNAKASMAYLFMSDTGDGLALDTCDPESGENAVVLQPGSYDGPTEALRDGPILQRWCRIKMSPKNFFEQLFPPHSKKILRDCEFKAALTLTDEPMLPDEQGNVFISSKQTASNEASLRGSKIGGEPFFIQSPQYPPGGPWLLLLQIDSVRAPFDIDFGDSGIGYVFITEDARQGRFLWQCM